MGGGGRWDVEFVEEGHFLWDPNEIHGEEEPAKVGIGEELLRNIHKMCKELVEYLEDFETPFFRDHCGESCES